MKMLTLLTFLLFPAYLLAEEFSLEDWEIYVVSPTDSSVINILNPFEMNERLYPDSVFSFYSRFIAKNNTDMNFDRINASFLAKTANNNSQNVFYSNVYFYVNQHIENVEIFDENNNPIDEYQRDTLQYLYPGWSFAFTSKIGLIEPEDIIENVLTFNAIFYVRFYDNGWKYYRTDSTEAIHFIPVESKEKIKPDSKYYIVHDKPIPDVSYYKNTGAKISNGMINTYQPRRTLKNEMIYAENSPSYWVQAPVIEMNRVDVYDEEYPEKAGDRLVTPIIDVSNESFVSISFRYQRTGRALKEYRLGWCDEMLIGPEHRVVEASDSSVIRQGDRLMVDIATSSDPNTLLNMTEEDWNIYDMLGKPEFNGTPPLTIFGGGGYSLAFPVENPDDVKSNNDGLFVDFSDHGKDQKFKNAVIRLPESLWSSQDKYLRIRLRVEANQDHENIDDYDNFYIDDFKVNGASADPLSSVVSIHCDETYTATHAKSYPLGLSANIICERDAPQLAVIAKVKKKNVLEWPANDSEMCKAVTIDNTMAYVERNVDLSGIILELDSYEFGTLNEYDIMVYTEYPGDALILNDTLYSEFSITYDNMIAYDPIEGYNNIRDIFGIPRGVNLPMNINPDGSVGAELGDIGGGSSGQIAMYFELTEPDTLIGYQGYFAPMNGGPDHIYYSIYTNFDGAEPNIPHLRIDETLLQSMRAVDDLTNDIHFSRYVTALLPEKVALQPGKYWMVIAQLSHTGFELGASSFRTGQVAMAIDNDDDLHSNSVYTNIYDGFREGSANKQLWAFEYIFSTGDWKIFSPSVGQPAYSHLDYVGSINEVETYSRGVWMPLIRPVFAKKDPTSVHQEESHPSEISIYPNPASDNVTISFSNNYDSHMRISLYDILGREIRTIFEDYISVGNISIDFDISHLQAGIYMVKLETGKKSEVIRFIKR